MKQHLSISQLAAEIERQQASKRDLIADTAKVDIYEQPVSPDPDSALDLHMNIRNGAATPLVAGAALTSFAHGQLAQKLGVPKPFYDRLREKHPDLLASMSTELMHREPERRMFRILDGRVRAVVSDRYRRLDNLDLAQAVLPELSGDPSINIVSAGITDERIYIKALFTKIEGRTAVGDVVQSGIVISNSEVGAGALSVSPLIYTLRCTNGMIAESFGQRKAHVGRQAALDEAAYELYADETLQADDRAFWLKVRDLVRAARDEARFRTILDRLDEAAGRKIAGDVPRVIELAQKQLGLSQAEGESVLRHLIEGGDLSQYGLHAAITRAAQEPESYDRATEMERIGGRVIELDSSAWLKLAA